MEYLVTSQLLTVQKAQQDLFNSNTKGLIFKIEMMDYILGISDLTGELMRLCINSVALGKYDNVEHISSFMRQIYDGTHILLILFYIIINNNEICAITEEKGRVL
jgi:predicted translin family RNA/ssDNA-binding protein